MIFEKIYLLINLLLIKLLIYFIAIVLKFWDNFTKILHNSMQVTNEKDFHLSVISF